MAAIDPDAVSATEGTSKGSVKKVTLASVLALVASLVGNALQWQKSTAELTKIRAEADGMVQQQRENATKSVQSWIEQLQKFDNVEDRVMVLSAAMSTTPYDSVKVWAKEQMLRLEGDLGKRKTEAAQQLAMAAAPEASPNAGGSAGIGSGIGLGVPGTLGHGAPTPRLRTRPTGGVTAPTPAPPALEAELAQMTARKTLDRVTLAESTLRATKVAKPPAPVPNKVPAL